MEFAGKTVEEATISGLKALGLTEENAEVTVVEEPTKGLFGRLKGKAIVKIEKKVSEKEETIDKVTDFSGLKRAEEFIQGVLDIMKISGKADIDEEKENPTINITASDSSAVIGFRGEILDALQTLAGAVANIDDKVYKKVVVDCENYRDKREATLIALAHKLEAKATDMRREVILEPMNPFERRIIHTALADSDTVTTRSDGKEPNRYVVIVPYDKDEFSRPYNAGRNNNFKKGDGKRNFKGGRSDRNRKGFSGGRKNNNHNGFTEKPARKKPSGFGTFLGNFKDED